MVEDMVKAKSDPIRSVYIPTHDTSTLQGATSWPASPGIGFPGRCVLARVGNTMSATTAFVVVVFPSDPWGHISVGVSVLGMV
jgi:hypothetical protein